jgi:hypothetical protein
MNATAKFYTGFVIALVLIVGLSFAAGYSVGSAQHASRPAKAARAR